MGRVREEGRSAKVIVNHGRAVAFLINDGILPSNEGCNGFDELIAVARRDGALWDSIVLLLFEIGALVMQAMQDAPSGTARERNLHHAYVLHEEERFNDTGQ